MLTIRQARHIAQQYLFKQTTPTGFQYHLEFPKIYLNHFYFDFILVAIDNKEITEVPTIGGACGFTIHRQTEKIEVLSFADLAVLETKYQQLETLYKDVLAIKNSQQSITSIKAKYQLSTKDILQIKKHLHQKKHQPTVFIPTIEPIICIARDENSTFIH